MNTPAMFRGGGRICPRQRQGKQVNVPRGVSLGPQLVATASGLCGVHLDGTGDVQSGTARNPRLTVRTRSMPTAEARTTRPTIMATSGVDYAAITTCVTECGSFQEEAAASGRTTEENNMRIVWKEWDVAPYDCPFGHGLQFHDRRKPRGASVVAWLEGFEWYHADPETVVIWCIPPDAITTTSVLTSAKKAIEEIVQGRQIPAGDVTPRIRGWANA